MDISEKTIIFKIPGVPTFSRGGGEGGGLGGSNCLFLRNL